MTVKADGSIYLVLRKHTEQQFRKGTQKGSKDKQINEIQSQ